MCKTVKKMRKTIMKSAANEDIYYINQTSYDRNIFNVQMCGITYPDKSYEILRNNSYLYCIEYIEKGVGTVNIDDKTFYPQEGDSYFLHSGYRHHYYSDKSNPWKKYFINISGSLVDSLVEGYQLKNSFHFKGLDISRELYSIIELGKQKKVDCTKEIICIINNIFYKMRECVKENNFTPELAEKMKDYLRINAASKFKMENLCKFISRSESQTIKIFKEAYGITPYAYFLDKKINLAKGMLLNTNLSIKQIAYNLSFTDEYYFSNVFKGKVGVSPATYRKAKSV